VEKRLFEPVFGRDSLVTSEGAEWKWQRQTVAPQFRHADLLSLVPVMIKATEEVIAEWRTVASGAVREIESDMSRATFKAMSDSMLYGGNEFVGNLLERAKNEYLRSVPWAAAHAFLKLPSWIPYPGRTTMMRTVDRLRSAVHEFIVTRSKTPSDRDDILGRLVKARDPETGLPMSNDRIVDNLLAFFTIGHVTISKALTWTLYLLARAPDWESRMLEEITVVLKGAPIEGVHIDRLIVTQQILKESMRLYPPVPIMVRVAREGTTLDGERLTAGTLIMISIYANHRNRKRWRDPDHFDPTRFEPKIDKEISRYEYMPFGAGPHICLGSTLAMIQVTAMLATIIRVAHFETVPGHVPTPESRVSLEPKGGMPLRVWMRAGHALGHPQTLS
jgi:cytochrome P450